MSANHSSSPGGPGVTVKICGITNPDDAATAVELGADALGFNLFAGSPRFIEIARNAEWIAPLSSRVATIAVLVNPTAEEAKEIAELGLFDWLQLHGNESPELCRDLVKAGVAVIKAIPIRDETSLQQPTDFGTRRVLLDSVNSRVFGGSGETFPWSLGRRFVEMHPELHVILAGGLTPENVADAIKAVRPAGVDVTSGVEAIAGRKDTGRLRAFIAAAKTV
jgi:phosphoribosylanthranilate isomerase